MSFSGLCFPRRVTCTTLVAVCLVSHWAAAQPEPPPPPEVPAALRAQIETTLAFLTIEYQGGSLHGVAICIDERGYYLTHSVGRWDDGKPPVLVIRSGAKDEQSLTPKLLPTNLEDGWSLLKVDGAKRLRAVQLGDAVAAKDVPLTAVEFKVTRSRREAGLLTPRLEWTPCLASPELNNTDRFGVVNRSRRYADNQPESGAFFFDDRGRLAGLRGGTTWNAPAIRKLISQPLLNFQPRPLALEKLAAEQRFSIEVVSLVRPIPNYQVTLALGDSPNLLRRIARPSGSGRYTVLATPVPGGREKGNSIRRLCPVDYEVLVELRGQEVSRTQGRIEVYEPGIQALPLSPQAPPLESERVRRALPGIVEDVIPAAGGRLLFFHHKAMKLLSAFDVSTARVIKIIPVPAEALVAASLQKLIVVDPETGVLDRWDLTTMRQDCRTSVPEAVGATGAAMGYASDGPLALSFKENSVKVHAPGLVNLGTLAGMHYRLSGNVGMFLNRVRMSPSGATAYLYTSSHSECQRVEIEDGVLRAFQNGVNSYVIPAPDGLTLHGRDSTFQKDQFGVRGFEGVWTVPSYLPRFCVALDFEPTGRLTPGVASLRLMYSPTETAFAKIPSPELWSCDAQNIVEKEGLPIHKRIHFVPQANLLVTVDQGLTSVVLRRIDISGALAKAGIKYLYCDSIPSPSVIRGEKYRYNPDFHSPAGKVKLKLIAAPAGMTLSPGGSIEWTVPTDYEVRQVKVAIQANDDGGQEAYQTFPIAIR